MTAVKHARGVQLLILIGQADGPPETFVAYCTINAARSVAGDAATNDFNIPDCTDPDMVGWLSREKVSLSYSASGAGILNTPDTIEFAEFLEDPLPRNCQIIVDVPAIDGGTMFAGLFHLTHFEITGDRGSKMEANLNFVSDGPITVSAVTAEILANARRGVDAKHLQPIGSREPKRVTKPVAHREPERASS